MKKIQKLPQKFNTEFNIHMGFLTKRRKYLI